MADFEGRGRPGARLEVQRCLAKLPVVDRRLESGCRRALGTPPPTRPPPLPRLTTCRCSLPTPADDSSLLAILLDVSPAAVAHLSATPGLSLQSMLEQVPPARLPRAHQSKAC